MYSYSLPADATTVTMELSLVHIIKQFADSAEVS